VIIVEASHSIVILIFQYEVGVNVTCDVYSGAIGIHHNVPCRETLSIEDIVHGEVTMALIRPLLDDIFTFGIV